MDVTTIAPRVVCSPAEALSGEKGGTASGPPQAKRAGRRRPAPLLIHDNKSSTPAVTSTYDQLSASIVTEGDRQGYSGLSRRLERYAKAHRRSLEMACWIRHFAGHVDESETRPRLGRAQDADRLAWEIESCGSCLAFRWYAGLDVVRLHAAKFCQADKLCPFCALRRGAKLLRKYAERIALVIRERPQLRGFMVTSTIKNGADLGERFNHHRRAIGTWMLRARHHRAGQRSTEFSKALGGVASYEFKRGKNSHSWHPHQHAVWLCEDEPDQHRLRQEWREITGDSHIVDVRPLHYLRDGLEPTAENIAGDAAEVFKYALKFSSMQPIDNWTAYLTLRARRLINSWGLLFGVPDPDLTDDLVDGDEPYIEWVYNFNRQAGEYRRDPASDVFC